MDLLDQFSAAYLHQRLDYNPITGEFVWNVQPGENRWNARHAGKAAGGWRENNGLVYKYIRIDCVSISAARIAWKMTFGETPPPTVDHANRNTTNNTIRNLREVTESESCINRNLFKNSKSGCTGVGLRTDGKWRAYISIKGKQTFLGVFSTKEEAVAARLKSEASEYGEFSPKFSKGE